jgi:hypothetical protein
MRCTVQDCTNTKSLESAPLCHSVIRETSAHGCNRGDDERPNKRSTDLYMDVRRKRFNAEHCYVELRTSREICGVFTFLPLSCLQFIIICQSIKERQSLASTSHPPWPACQNHRASTQYTSMRRPNEYSTGTYINMHSIHPFV